MNPVWALYNELRTARLTVKYLQRKLRTLKRINLSYEIIRAVAGFSFLQQTRAAQSGSTEPNYENIRVG
jgi:hypothetical protein